jgi:zinc protease
VNLKQSISIASVLFIGCGPKPPPTSPSLAQQVAELSMTDPLPFDPAITTGTLDNGLRYFIEPNAYPKDRVELRLVLPVGSLQEDPDQLGLAHFLEHMAFNGTTHFEAGELVSFLESTGVQFGAHLNASTSFDATTFMLALPSDDPELLDQGMLILTDWAQGMRLEAEEIEKERGVVLEEWRRAQGAGFRTSQLSLPLLLGDDYGSRWPIGTEESLLNFEHDALRRFYKDWYRPDLMGVVVVGDVDTAQMESRIRDLFGSMVVAEDARTPTKAELPVHPDGAILILTDPELQSPSIQLNRTEPFQWGGDLEFLKSYIAGRMASQMLNERIGFLARQDDAPILGAGGGRQVFNADIRIASMGIGVTEDKIEVGLEAVLTELRRASLHGFTEPEWQRALAQSRSMWETIIAEDQNTDSANHASEILRHFLTGEYMPGTDIEYYLVKRIMDEVLTIEDANQAMAGFMPASNRVLILSLPEKEGLEPPTEEALRSLIARVDASQPEPPEAETEARPLVTNTPEPGSVIEESHIEKLDLTTWVLSNGVQVHLMPTDLKEDEILFSSYSWGGLSLHSDEDFIAGSTAVSLTQGSGLGEHDVDSLVRMLAGVTAGVSPMLSSLSQGLAGNSAPRDLETLFQLIHLRVVEPRFDTNAYERMQNNMRTGLQNRLVNPQVQFSDKRNELLFGGHFRTRPWTIDTVEEMDLERSEAVLRERFADMSEQHFFFVGSFELDQMRPLVETWLASLPSTGGEESWSDPGIRYAEGFQSAVLYAGTEPKASVSIDFMGDFSFSRDTAYQMGAAAQSLEQILRTRLREELGGTYSVSVQSATGRIPNEDYGFTISFGCDPERVDELKAVVYAEIERLKNEKVPAEEVASIIEMDLRELETNRQRNGYWLHMLQSYHQRGEDPLMHLSINERFQSLTAEQIQQVFIQYFNLDRRVETVLMPESYAP